MKDDISGGVGINVLICAAVSLQACSPVWSVLLSNIDFVFMSRGTNNDEQTRDQSQLTLDLWFSRRLLSCSRSRRDTVWCVVLCGSRSAIINKQRKINILHLHLQSCPRFNTEFPSLISLSVLWSGRHSLNELEGAEHHTIVVKTMLPSSSAQRWYY